MANKTNKKTILGVAATGLAAGVAAGIAASTLADGKTRKKIVNKINDFKGEYMEKGSHIASDVDDSVKDLKN